MNFKTAYIHGILYGEKNNTTPFGHKKLKKKRKQERQRKRKNRK